jgi:hypothetical protein
VIPYRRTPKRSTIINGLSSRGVAMSKQYDRDAKIAYVEQIRAGKLTAIEAARELGLRSST